MKINQRNLDLDSENTWLSRNPSKFALNPLFLFYVFFENKPKNQIFQRQMINRKGFREAGNYRGGNCELNPNKNQNHSSKMKNLSLSLSFFNFSLCVFVSRPFFVLIVQLHHSLYKRLSPFDYLT